MKRFLSFVVVLTLLVTAFPSLVSASAEEGVVFYNNVNGEKIKSLDGVSEIYADMTFESASTSATVIGAHYNFNGKLEKTEFITPLNAVAGYTTPAFSVENTDVVKIFAWSDFGFLTPVLKTPGVICKTPPLFTDTETILTSGDVTAVVPNGVLLESGVSALTLTTSTLESSESGITADENEELTSLDVHIDGISENNTVPVIITLPEVADKGLNKGNLALYHVENGETVMMEEVESEEDLTKHNQFTYEPLDGTVTLAMATFSEVALLSDTENAWNGEFKYNWYDKDAENLIIANADQLAGFGKIVGGMADGIERDSFADQTIKLNADINLGDAEADNKEDLIFYPIGYYFTEDKNADGTADDVYSTVYSFEGIFDGNGNTISNFYHNTWEMDGDYNSGYPAGSNHYKDGMGLFGYVYGGTVKNLTVDNFSSDGEFAPTGVIAAYAAGEAKFENIALKNCNPRTYNTGVAGIVGWDLGGDTQAEASDYTFTNITIDNTNKISALWGSWDVPAGGLMGYLGTYSTVNMTNCHVAAQIDVNNDVCGNYQYYWYRYSGMMIGTIDRHTTDANGYTVPDTTGITATDCTVHFGDWNDYYYCELVANSIASYTHDHQFSRLTQVDSVDAANMTVKVGEETTAIPTSGRYNYVVVDGEASTENATCYHFVNGSLWTHDMAGAEDSVDVNSDGVIDEKDLKEDKQHIYLPFNQLFTGYGWGVKNIPVYNGENYAFDGIKILDRDIADSVVKFEKADTAKDEYVTETTVTAGDLFAAVANAGVAVDEDNVWVFVSPADENSTVTGVYTADTTNWTQSTLTFNGLGSAIVTITDYYFCTPTTISVTVTQPVSVDKFTKTALTTVTAGESLPLTNLFAANSGVTVDSSNITLNVSGTADYTYTPDTSDWANSTLTFNATAENVVVSINDNNYCNTAEIALTVVENKSFTTQFQNTESYLYRVGNANAITLSSLFDTANNATIYSDVTVSAVSLIDGATVLTASFNKDTWADGNIDFANDFTGPVAVTIDAIGATPYTLNLEVVSAKNVTDASFSGNTVLLNDVSISNTISANGVVYGNGFTVDMTNAPISEKNGAVFHLYDGTILKNLKIVGKEFTTVAANVNETNYGVSAVRAWDTVVIENCYISGCRSAVSVTGTELIIKDSVIANGIYANVDFRSGILNLHNVTTVNEPHTVDDTTVVGLGIVGNMTASAGRNINITGTLTQYNWVSQADCENIKATGVSDIYNSVFTDEKYESLRYTYNGTNYVNTGILSLCSDFGASATTGVPSNYSGMDVTATIGLVSVDGYVWAPAQAGTLTDADMAYHNKVYEWTPSNQGTSFIAPDFDYTNSNFTVENEVVQISYEVGDSVTLTDEELREIFPAKKYGKDLSYIIAMDGEVYDNGIIFDAEATKTYTITYIITDNLVYDATGKHTEETYEITKDLKVKATVEDKSADAPTFTFYYGTNGSASAGTPHTKQPTNSYTSTIKQIGETYYIMPNVTATSTNAIGSQTIDGETVYYPIVDGINVRDGYSTDYNFTRYYPIFKAVKISDNGTEYSYDATTKMPDTVVWESATIDNGNSASGLKTEIGLYNNQYLCKIQTKAGDTESGGTSVVKFNYTALDGNTYYYYAGYRFYDEDEGGACFTDGTLITLADGAQKAIEDLTFEDKILAWDFFTGEYVEKDIALLVNHGEDLYKIANMEFSDGAVLRIIGDHGVFDYDLNKYVYITSENISDYIGHRFVKYNANGGYDIVTMTNGYVTEEYTSAYSITSAATSNAFASGILTVAPPADFYNWIEMGDKLRYDTEQFAKDVETYGLYTYDVFEDYVTYEQFIDWNGAYLKIPVEKGIFTFDYILELIELYSSYMPE